jgi:hypothetical protein
MADHELGASAYALRAVRAAAPEGGREEAVAMERLWQREHLPPEIRELVMDDQKLRNRKCWRMFL